VKDEMDWDAYAKHYDEMCELNPAYRENIELLLKRLPEWDLPEAASICDVGAGTGNYIAALAGFLPLASFTHLDFDGRMIQTAKTKHELKRIANVSYVQGRAQDVDFPAQSFDLIICVNALYAISPQRDMLARMRGWLKPNGRLFIIDFGRRQKTLDWTIYVFVEAVKSFRLVRYLRALVSAREVLKQNRQTTKGQESGRYWLHSTKEFEASLMDCGFNVQEAFPCYRGYCDCAICTVEG
jgi:ubiquinone/menaquinone biosynthesis C-methylase UbiE